MAIILKSKKEYEKFFQEMFRKMLPKLDPKHIRAAYKNYGLAGKEIDDDVNYDDGLTGFSPDDLFVYFNIKFRNSTNSIADEHDNLSVLRFVDLNVSVYGEDSFMLATIIIAKIRSYGILSACAKVGLQRYTESEETAPIHEVINGEWWTRHDFTITFDEVISISLDNDTPIAKGGLKVDDAEKAVLEINSNGNNNGAIPLSYLWTSVEVESPNE